MEITKSVPGSGVAIWLTGMSGAGKSTIAGELGRLLRERGRSVEILDGDEIREELSKGLTFSREDREENVSRIAYVASLLVKHGVTVITAAISPYARGRNRARDRIGNFIEVYFRCSLEALARRACKGLYARALRGEIQNFTGISDPYEPPENPDVIVDSSTQTVQESLQRIVAAIDDYDACEVPRD